MSQKKSSETQHSQEEDAKTEAEEASSGAEPAQSSSLAQDPTRPIPPAEASDLEENLPEIDEGPRPGPVDPIQEALFEAAKANVPTEVEFDSLTKPGQEPADFLDSGPVDEVQEAIFRAAQEGKAVEVDFDTLPEPTPATTRKVIEFDKKEEAIPEPSPDVEPQEDPPPQPETSPELSEAESVPTVPDFWLLLALFVVFRVLTLLLLRPGGFIRDWSDFDTYFGIASLSDYALYPFVNFWLEWPPLVPWLAVGAYQLALTLPPWTDDPRLWFVVILGSIFVLFEVGNFYLIYRLARRLFQIPGQISRVLWIYALLFPPIYAMLGFFDGIALFFMLLALELLLSDRRFMSAITVGAGFLVKIVPLLMLPVALRRVWYQYRANNRNVGIEIGLYVVAFGLTVMLLLVPFLLVGPQWVLTSFRSMLGRSSWETIWAVAEGYYGFGQVVGDRLNPAETNFAVHQGWPAGIWWLITLIFAAIYAFIFTRRADYSRARNMVAFTGLTVTLFMIYSKGYSPQFLVYLLPWILLLMPTGRGLTYMLVLTGLNLLEQPVYFILVPQATWLLIFIVVVRLLVMLVVAIEFALVLWPTEKRLAPFAHARLYVPVALGGLAVLALVVLTPLTIQAYTTSQATASPVGAFAGFMETHIEADPSGSAKPRLLLSDQDTYRQLYPHLRQTLDLQLTDGASRNLAEAATIPELLRGLDQVWILPTGPQAKSLTSAVASRGDALASYNFEGLGTASLYTFRPNPIPLIASARFSGGIELVSHQIELRPSDVELTLYWRATNPQAQNLTVFTQIVNEAGELVAGHDSVPRGGTAPVTTWAIDTIVTDPHRIDLPLDLPPGQYTIITGLYNSFNERLRSVDPEGFGHPNRAVPLGTLQLQ
jgi:hypothetical protein